MIFRAKVLNYIFDYYYFLVLLNFRLSGLELRFATLLSIKSYYFYVAIVPVLGTVVKYL